MLLSIFRPALRKLPVGQVTFQWLKKHGAAAHASKRTEEASPRRALKLW